jgi:SAM-dependent methyltransferase
MQIGKRRNRKNRNADKNKLFNYYPMSPIAARTKHLNNWFSSDIQFHLLYPASIQQLARRHWTPLNVVRMASEFLVTGEGDRILDIGSGVGKFCLSASYYKPNAFFDGVEQRDSLVEHAKTTRNILGLFNVNFIHGNFTQLSFEKYDHFYFYNSFFENLEGADKIDDSIQYSPALYNYYSGYLYKELEKMPAGTRVVTYCSWQDEIPPSYSIVQIELDGLLKFNIKV